MSQIHPLPTVVVFLVTLTIAIIAMPDAASAFDRDGERVRAHRCKLDSPTTDSVTHETDADDWHYVEVMRDGQLVVTVEVTPANSGATVSITNATGDELAASHNAADGKHKLSVKAVAGVYYIHIAAGKGETQYTMTAKVEP